MLHLASIQQQQKLHTHTSHEPNWNEKRWAWTKMARSAMTIFLSISPILITNTLLFSPNIPNGTWSLRICLPNWFDPFFHFCLFIHSESVWLVLVSARMRTSIAGRHKKFLSNASCTLTHYMQMCVHTVQMTAHSMCNKKCEMEKCPIRLKKKNNKMMSLYSVNFHLL